MGLTWGVSWGHSDVGQGNWQGPLPRLKSWWWLFSGSFGFSPPRLLYWAACVSSWHDSWFLPKQVIQENNAEAALGFMNQLRKSNAIIYFIFILSHRNYHDLIGEWGIQEVRTIEAIVKLATTKIKKNSANNYEAVY